MKRKENKKILVIGDLHFRDSLGYADHIDDRRESERKEVLDFIVENSSDCDKIVMLGDQLNARNNSSEVIRQFVEFIEQFKNKRLYILAGNHEKRGNGKSAIDFLEEIQHPNRFIITRNILKTDEMVFCPYFTRAELNAKDIDEGLKILMKKLPNGKMLFVHHAISDTLVQSGISTNIFNEIVLPKKELEKKFDLIVGGHIHKPEQYKKTLVAGSIFNNEVGEDGKCIWKIDESDLLVEKIDLPGRKILRLENPAEIELKKLKGKGTILKIIITDKKLNIEDLKKATKKFDACIISEQYNIERKKNVTNDLLDFNIENLLKVYADSKKIDYNKLLEGFNLIKSI